MHEFETTDHNSKVPYLGVELIHGYTERYTPRFSSSPRFSHVFWDSLRCMGIAMYQMYFILNKAKKLICISYASV